jgi:hypothetical protein
MPGLRFYRFDDISRMSLVNVLGMGRGYWMLCVVLWEAWVTSM